MGSNISPWIRRLIERDRFDGLIGKRFDEEHTLLSRRVINEEFLQTGEEILKGGYVVGLDAQAIDVLNLVFCTCGGRRAKEGFLVNLIPLNHGDCLFGWMSADEPLDERGAFVQWTCVDGVDNNICLEHK